MFLCSTHKLPKRNGWFREPETWQQCLINVSRFDSRVCKIWWWLSINHCHDFAVKYGSVPHFPKPFFSGWVMPISSIQFHPWTPPNEGVRPSQLPCIGGCGLGAPLVQKGRPSNFGRTWSASCMLATHFSLKKSSSSKARWNPVVWLATSLIFWWGRLMTTRKSWQKAYLAARQVQHLLPPVQQAPPPMPQIPLPIRTRLGGG